MLLLIGLLLAAGPSAHRAKAEHAEALGRMQEAARELEAAWDEEQAPELLYRLGLARRKLKQYAKALSGDILALALEGGATVWSYNAGAPIRGPLAPGCDGILYAATDGAIVALVTDAAGLADSPWPRAAHDVRGTSDARRPLRSATGTCLE